MPVWKAGDPGPNRASRPAARDRTGRQRRRLAPRASLRHARRGRRPDYHVVLKRLTSTGEVMRPAVSRETLRQPRGSSRSEARTALLRAGPGGKSASGAAAMTSLSGRPAGLDAGGHARRCRPIALALHRGGAADRPYQPIGRGRRMITEGSTRRWRTRRRTRSASPSPTGRVPCRPRLESDCSRTPINPARHARRPERSPPTPPSSTCSRATTRRRGGNMMSCGSVRTWDPSTMFSVPHLTFGDNILPDLRLMLLDPGGMARLPVEPSPSVRRRDPEGTRFEAGHAALAAGLRPRFSPLRFSVAILRRDQISPASWDPNAAHAHAGHGHCRGWGVPCSSDGLRPGPWRGSTVEPGSSVRRAIR